jgi:nitric oxide reductase subunit C
LKLAVLSFLILSAAVFSILVYRNGSDAIEINKQAQQGKLLWQSYNCQACHQLYGLGGYMGPDLTNVISSPGKGPHYVNALLITGTAKMPNFKLSDSQRVELIAFLTAVSQSGQYPLKTDDIDFRWGSFLIRNIKKH